MMKRNNETQEHKSFIVSDQSLNVSNVTAIPSSGKKLDMFSVDVFVFGSLQTSFERVVDDGFCHCYQAI